MKAVFAALFIIVFASSSYAGLCDWTVYIDGTDASYQYNPCSIKKIGNKAKISTRNVYKDSYPLAPDVKYTTTDIVFDCKKATFVEDDTWMFGEDEKIVTKVRASGSEEDVMIRSNELLMNKACFGKNPIGKSKN